ncbi:hypothetical protein HYFRA_00011860 [Hymenoscyphus fraxineus]|uniref:Ubiquitin-like-conjugating enzyme ATG10 n=1 Tax=Hymenoscyphus fraxineus TaxID=746836 RepID=A0A9N9PQR6_9HELO|nr:hypothetical protein HYFRA_00011860 [Hymenoscyphus fraxineus]
MSHQHEYRQWPFLTEEEFNLACAFLDQRYIRAQLGPTRKIFKINSRRTATTGGLSIEILRILQLVNDEDELSMALGKLSGGEDHSRMDMDISNEEADEEALQPQLLNGLPNYSLYPHQPYVTYEIHLHPTYRMPTLWFTLHDLPMGDPTFDLNSIYRYLVPEEYKTQLRAAGFTGGISAAPHPVNDVPAFFIHPCQTKEAMENFDIPLDKYLMVWIGLVGGCVGLWIPPEMAKDE